MWFASRTDGLSGARLSVQLQGARITDGSGWWESLIRVVSDLVAEIFGLGTEIWGANRLGKFLAEAFWIGSWVATSDNMVLGIDETYIWLECAHPVIIFLESCSVLHPIMCYPTPPYMIRFEKDLLESTFLLHAVSLVQSWAKKSTWWFIWTPARSRIPSIRVGGSNGDFWISRFENIGTILDNFTAVEWNVT